MINTVSVLVVKLSRRKVRTDRNIGGKDRLSLKEKKKRSEEVIAKNIRKTKELMAKANIPNSHTTSLKSPPPYEKEVEYNDVYPQLPAISQVGK